MDLVVNQAGRLAEWSRQGRHAYSLHIKGCPSTAAHVAALACPAGSLPSPPPLLCLLTIAISSQRLAHPLHHRLHRASSCFPRRRRLPPPLPRAVTRCRVCASPHPLPATLAQHNGPAPPAAPRRRQRRIVGRSTQYRRRPVQSRPEMRCIRAAAAAAAAAAGATVGCHACRQGGTGAGAAITAGEARGGAEVRLWAMG